MVEYKATVCDKNIVVDAIMPPSPGGRCDKRNRRWVYPATNAIAYNIVQSGISSSPEVVELSLGIVDADRIRKSGDAPEPSIIPSWKHQRVAHAFASRIQGAALVMYMGTGKTKVAIDLIRSRQAKTVLIVCPKRVIPVWGEQIEKWGDSDWTYTYMKSSKKPVFQYWKMAKIGIINYESVWRPAMAKWLVDNPPDMLILDESHKIKSPGSHVSKFLSALGRRVQYRLALTGTPAHDTPMDVYSQMRFVDPGVFGNNFSNFKSRYAIMGGFENRQIVGYQNLDELIRKMSMVSFRCEGDVLELPPVTDAPVSVDLGATARGVYTTLRDEFVAEALGGEISAQNSVVKILRLQQITGGTIKLDDGPEQEIDTSKEETLVELLLDASGPFVVFAKFRADLDRVRRAASTAGRRCYELSGEEDTSDDWKKDDNGVIAVQIRSGGAGVDLTHSHYAAYYSVGHSLGDYEQSRSRLVRSGQTRPVTFYHLIASGTVDVDVYRALKTKTSVVETVMEGLRK